MRVRVKVKDSAAVVVGGASGMGRATAERLAERVATIAVLDLPTSDGAAVAEELGASFHPCNVTDSDEVEAALALAIVENQMLNGSAIRLDAGQRFAPK
jgi:NAD(P)-dependent dehydrogenase (short-subunit alcohol dehydrogenase family)